MEYFLRQNGIGSEVRAVKQRLAGCREVAITEELEEGDGFGFRGGLIECNANFSSAERA